MIGKNTKVCEKLADWLRAAGMDNHELSVLHCSGTWYSVFLDGNHFAEYDAKNYRLALLDVNGLYQFRVLMENQELPAKRVILEI